ncbi:MAG: non-homologous end-joining DNA ligase [Candidatus Limnocylindria bacterium]
MSPEPAPVIVGGIPVTHPDKIWWPEEGITKVDIARYYDGMAERIAPWLRERPMTAERCPLGMRGPCYYQKNFAKGLPDGVPTFAIRAESTKKDVHYVVGGSKRALIALVQLGCITMHVMNSRVSSLHEADWLAFDLDPSSGSFSDAAKAGIVLREILDELRLRSFPKTSGSRGLHVLVPLRAGYGQDAARDLAVSVGRELAERAPTLVTMAHGKAAREGRVYADPFRNGFAQTIATPYSVRRKPHAPVSAPLDWDEVRTDLDPASINVRTIEKRLGGTDPWAGFARARQRLPAWGSADRA